MRAFLLALLIASPAYAGDLVGWGRTDQSTARIVPGSGGFHVADVLLHNRLTALAGDWTRGVIDLDGLEVVIEWAHGPGDAPDTVTIIVPPGYEAYPPRVVLEEGETARVEIYQEPVEAM